MIKRHLIQEENACVLLCMTVSPEVLSELIDRHLGPLMSWVGPHSGIAEDIVQQTFIKLAGLDVVPENNTAWLYTVSRNEAINQSIYAHRRRRRQQLASQPESVSADTVWASAEAAELAETLAQLPDELRQVVVARIWGDLSFEEIGTLLGCCKATVWRRYESALLLLRKTYGVSCQAKT